MCEYYSSRNLSLYLQLYIPTVDTWTSPELLATPSSISKDVMNDNTTLQLGMITEASSLIGATKVPPVNVKDDECSSTLLFSANPDSTVIPSHSHMTTSHPGTSYSHGKIIPCPTIETDRHVASVIPGISVIDLFTPSSTTPSQTISTSTVLSRATASLPSTFLHNLESALQGPTSPIRKTKGRLTEFGSATPIPNSNPFMSTVTSGTDLTTEEIMVSTGRHNEILSYLGRASLWVWVTVVFIILAITSCCFILCIVVVAIANKHAKETNQVRENCLRSFRMSLMYGDIEEGRQLKTNKKKLNRMAEETVPNRSTDVECYCRNVTLCRRNSQRTFSTFKPHLNLNEHVANL